MSVELTPQELGFRRESCGGTESLGKRLHDCLGPFNREVTETLKLANPNNEPIAFKVRTTWSILIYLVANSMRNRSRQQLPSSTVYPDASHTTAKVLPDIACARIQALSSRRVRWKCKASFLLTSKDTKADIM